MNNTTDDRETAPTYPALSHLEKNHPPMKYGRGPYWRPEIPKIAHNVVIPAWNWSSVHELPAESRVINLDANGMYLGALTGSDIAMSQLRPSGGFDHVPDKRQITPGYYRIVVPHWAFDGTIVSPLGNVNVPPAGSDMWIMAPTLILLIELYELGAIAEVTILESLTGEVTGNFRDWSAHLKGVRVSRLHDIAHANTDATRAAMRDRYEAFKEGYSMAFSMMLTGEKCKTRRPDWAHTVRAQAHAAQWRKGWRFTETGLPILAMGDVDEITIFAADLPVAMSRPKPPFRVDESGFSLGAFKTKSIAAPAIETQRTANAPAALVDDDEFGGLL